jgi:ligand-binding SRPBCC domain-containing protein
MSVPVGLVLSGSTNGRDIPVAATATAGTLIHTVGSTGFDEIWLFAANVTAITATLTVEWGGVSDPGDHLVHAYPIPPNSLPYPIATGRRWLSTSRDGLTGCREPA